MPFRSVHGGTAFLIPASLKIPYLGKVCRSFGHGLKNDGRPCPWKSPCRSLHGRLGGQGLRQKNRLCPNIGQTLPTTITDLAHNLSWQLSDTAIKPPSKQHGAPFVHISRLWLWSTKNPPMNTLNHARCTVILQGEKQRLARPKLFSANLLIISTNPEILGKL